MEENPGWVYVHRLVAVAGACQTVQWIGSTPIDILAPLICGILAALLFCWPVKSDVQAAGNRVATGGLLLLALLWNY